MEPISGSMIIGGALISGVAQIVGQLMQSGDADAARRVIQDAVDKYGPEAYGVIERELGGPSALEGLNAETIAPEAAAAQRNALRQLQQVSEKGYTPEEEAAIRQIQSETAATAASQRAATQEAFARRGISGGGAERVAAFQAASQAANRAGQQGLDVAAQAQKRAFQAMQQTGALGGSMRGQAFEEGRTRAAADEARRINRARMKMDVMGNEVDMKTGAARSRAATENQPWQATSEIVGRAGQTYGGYLGTPEKKKKPYDSADPSTW